MDKRKVVVTGMGVVSPLGCSLQSFWDGLIAGRSGVGPITRFDVSAYAVKIAAELKDFRPDDYIDRKEARRMDPFVQYAMAASIMAMKDSGLNLDQVDKDRMGVIIGSGIGGLHTFEEQYRIILEKGPGRVSPFFIPMMITDMASGMVSIQFGAKGPNYAAVSACASAAHSIGVAYRAIQNGEADVMITGGSENPIGPSGLAGFCSLKALSSRDVPPEKASCPFDKMRDGFVMGEGSGIVILESLEHAKARNARIYCEMAGYGFSGDAYHMTAPAPDGEGPARAMKAALVDSGIGIGEVDYINAHGTSTEFNDKYETMAIKTVFGERAQSIKISSTKSMTGHLLGAAAAVEFVASALAIQNSKIPPTINYENPDPECDLDYTPNKAVEMPVRVALSNSLGFGGHNAALVLRRL